MGRTEIRVMRGLAIFWTKDRGLLLAANSIVALIAVRQVFVLCLISPQQLPLSLLGS